MKRILLALVLLLAFGTREVSAFGYDWGLTGGVNMTKLKVKNATIANFSTENWAGWFVGPKVNLSLIAGVGADAAVLYNQQQIGTKTGDELWRSLEIPINARYNIGLGKVASVYIATGPQFGFNLGNFKGFDTENMYTTWNIGAGVKLLGRLEVGLGYNFGLGKLGELVDTSNSPAGSLKKNAFQLKAAVYF